MVKKDKVFSQAIPTKFNADIGRVLKRSVKLLVDTHFDRQHTYKEQDPGIKYIPHRKICTAKPVSFIKHTANHCAIQRFAMDYFVFKYRRHDLRDQGINHQLIRRHGVLPRARPKHSVEPSAVSAKSGREERLTRRDKGHYHASVLKSKVIVQETISPTLFPAMKQKRAITQSFPSIVCSTPWIPPPINSTTSPKYRINEVEDFLKNCFPDMRYLLNTFMDSGIRNRQYLSVIAGWPAEEIEQFLRGMGTSTMFCDSGPTEMDIKLLIKHFKQYFNVRS